MIAGSLASSENEAHLMTAQGAMPAEGLRFG